uniref:U5 small nuclear ribonucleoprotein 200 kDa helicase n=1 Tax=Dermatophagoides pteronyssinus TaxID=6956 RepID=A0A6P6YBY5_DERPT|nr:putative U5 small nuclear ribonucleoprotein 200 kDa helicase [Dermatophagoides pteronyssinus]
MPVFKPFQGVIQEFINSIEPVNATPEDSKLEIQHKEVHYAESKNIVLPSNCVRKDYESYVEICIPVSENTNDKQKSFIKALNVFDVLPSFAHVYFEKRSIKYLNLVQSTVFDTIFKTSLNSLICAPTGSGKTLIALLAILQVISKHYNEADKILGTDQFKIIYISPMKALVAEQIRYFQNLFDILFESSKGAINLNVCEMTGDFSVAESSLHNYQLLICTPEKFDIMMHNSNERMSMALIQLIIFDELHLLHSPRGPVLESIITKFIFQKKPVRLIGLSATLKNYDIVSNFLGISKQKLNDSINIRPGLFVFGDNFRPVPLNKKLICYNDDKDEFDLFLNTVLTYVKTRKQIIVFTHSRASTSESASALYENLVKSGRILDFFNGKIENNPFSEFLTEKSANFEDNTLKVLVKYAIAFHHAGLSRNDRDLIESMFFQGHIKLICCTSTLAWGVNLPAHTVIIKGLEYYNSDQKKIVELNDLDILQMFGRAGRPPFDKTGNGVVLASKKYLYKLVSLLLRQNDILSKINQFLEMHLLLSVSTRVSRAL